MGSLAVLRSHITGAELVALANIDTDMIMAWDTEVHVSQDRLLSLAETAHALLRFENQEAVKGCFTDLEGIDQAVLMDTEKTNIFVRIPSAEEDVICIVASVSTDVGAAVEHAKTYLKQINTIADE